MKVCGVSTDLISVCDLFSLSITYVLCVWCLGLLSNKKFHLRSVESHTEQKEEESKKPKTKDQLTLIM